MRRLRNHTLAAQGVNLYEMADYAKIRREDGQEFLARIDRRLAEKDKQEPVKPSYPRSS